MRDRWTTWYAATRTAARAWTAAAGPLSEHVEALLLPRSCVSCERPMSRGREAMVCDACWARVATLPYPRCERCGHPGVGESCRWCPILPPYVRAARSWCWIPGGVSERILYAMKYDGWHGIAPELAERMARLTWPADVRDECAALIPVPLAADRLRTRGYNQSRVLADALAPHLGVPVWDDVIERQRATPSQTRLTPEQRLTNVAHAFRVVTERQSKLRGAHVILVDDVVTTAATLNECATTLWDAGARIISYVTFGRARAAGDAPLSRG